ncbi:hypothetical protein DFH08DRAFT_824163 [Mycena albidolilacea]|uniref:Uncharacterized protein n=1 Tax=Mycena albidolilacea TaxID=1033008 RepID=A0AAD6Z4E9_9AGAR|nr:hypothetical protein DFH08DRAFT_824163 [Mycena albidolilacea]
MRKPVSRLSEQTGLASRQNGLQADLPGLGLDLNSNPSPSPNKPIGAGASLPLSGLSLIEFQRGDYSRALQLTQDTYRIARALGNVWGEVAGIQVLAQILWSAISKLEGPSSETRTHVAPYFVTPSMQICGFARATQWGPESSIFGFFLLHRTGTTNLRGQAADDTAFAILTIVLEGFTQMDVHQSRAKCMCTMGDVYMRRGDLSKARGMWEAARPLFKRSEQKKEVARIDERLQTLGIAQYFEALPKAESPVPQIPLQESDTEEEEQKPQ